MVIGFSKKNLIIAIVVLLIVVFSIIFHFDRALFLGLLLIIFLSVTVFFILYKLKLVSKALCSLFLIALFIHLGVILLFHYTHFQPFGAGDFVGYQQTAEQVAQRIHQGVYSLKGLDIPHYYPVLIGIIYALTMPEMIIGQLFSVWLAVCSVLLTYLIVLEIGGSKKSAFLVGMIVSVYPSFIYFGSLLLKDTVILPLVLLGILLSTKMLKNFDALKFLAFFIVLTCAIHIRFYIGFALMFSFILCWFLISNFKMDERFIYGLTFIFLLGFSPQLLGYGYYGAVPLGGYLNKETITTYREVVYAPSPSIAPVANNESSCENCLAANPAPANPAPNNVSVNNPNPCAQCAQTEDSAEDSGVGSSFVVKAGFDSTFSFVKNYFESFIYAFLGPFPWQLKYKRHLFFLLETIPWYSLICFIAYGIYKSLKMSGRVQTFNHYRFAILPLFFSIMALGALSLFINNFGIIVRIRMPVFIVILCFIGLDKNIDNIINKITHNFFKLCAV